MPGTTALAVPCFMVGAAFTVYVMRVRELGMLGCIDFYCICQKYWIKNVDCGISSQMFHMFWVFV